MVYVVVGEAYVKVEEQTRSVGWLPALVAAAAGKKVPASCLPPCVRVVGSVVTHTHLFSHNT